MSKQFTIDRYHKTIKAYLDEGYVFSNVEFSPSIEKNIVMVHDVDHDIALCENFILVEKSLGISATYFLRLHGRSYNMLSRDSINMAKKILQAGGVLGLHYEPTFNKDEVQYKQHIESELKILSSVVGEKINYFNLHEPARTGVELSEVLPNKNRCYNSLHFKEYKYLSDSSCHWREGCFSEHVGKWKKMLVLTHPIWWYNQCPAENY